MPIPDRRLPELDLLLLDSLLGIIATYRTRDPEPPQGDEPIARLPLGDHAERSACSMSASGINEALPPWLAFGEGHRELYARRHISKLADASA